VAGGARDRIVTCRTARAAHAELEQLPGFDEPFLDRVA
jgi:hypothetical protein